MATPSTWQGHFAAGPSWGLGERAAGNLCVAALQVRSILIAHACLPACPAALALGCPLRSIPFLHRPSNSAHWHTIASPAMLAIATAKVAAKSYHTFML